MARKTQKVIIDQDGRDKGKTFLITEMPVFQIEQWGSRAILAIVSSGNHIDLDIDPRAGILGMAGKLWDVLSAIKPEDALPLWNELMGCVQVLNNNGKERPLLLENGEDIEEWTTIFQLKKEALLLHVGFLKSVAESMKEKFKEDLQESENTPT